MAAPLRMFVPRIFRRGAGTGRARPDRPDMGEPASLDGACSKSLRQVEQPVFAYMVDGITKVTASFGLTVLFGHGEQLLGGKHL